MMNAKSMANAIKNSGLSGCQDAASALQKFWKAVCDYVSNNAQVTYSWYAMSTTEPPTVDPVVVLNCKIKAFGSLSPCNLTETNAALAAMSAQMNASAATWLVLPDTTKSPMFTVSTGFVIPSINLSVSNINDPSSALEYMCGQIIAGIKSATPTLTGNHSGVYFGSASFTTIL